MYYNDLFSKQLYKMRILTGLFKLDNFLFTPKNSKPSLHKEKSKNG